MTTITLRDFQKLDIRIGLIKAVELLENSKKLLKLTVEFGGESRVILAGLGQTVANPSELVGIQAPFLTNLEPKIIAGVTSEGMLLVADDGQPVLLVPTRVVKLGSVVR